MKNLHPLWKLKLGVRSTVLLLGTITSIALLNAKAAPTVPAAATAAAPVPTTVNVATTNYPAGVTEILKLLNANVDRETVKAYIHNSFNYWNLSADDIIRLKERGVPSDVISAMLDRNAELRDQAVRAAQAQAQANANPNAETSGPYGTGPTVSNPIYDAGQYVTTGVYPNDYGYVYPYPYPYDYYYGWYGWPVWGGGVICFDSYGHCHFDHHHDGHSFHNGFHNGANDFHGNFRSGSGFNRANQQAVNGFPGVSQQVSGLGFTHNRANLQAVNGFPGTSLPRSTTFSGSHVMTGGNFAGSMRSVPRMGGVTAVGHAGGMSGGSFGHAGGMGGGVHMGGGGGGMHMGGGMGGGGGGHGIGR